ncbi:MAG: hypothetical protein FWD13_01405 [Treponema sp.]|nr:hypothetical protein [Treponema sp.]
MNLQKWVGGSIQLKVATVFWGLALLASIILNIMMISYEVDEPVVFVIMIVTVLMMAGMTFGLLMVNKIAKVFAYIFGICSLIFVLMIALAISLLADFLGPVIMEALVGAILGGLEEEGAFILVLFVLPYIASIIAWIALVAGGKKDFVNK